MPSSNSSLDTSSQNSTPHPSGSNTPTLLQTSGTNTPTLHTSGTNTPTLQTSGTNTPTLQTSGTNTPISVSTTKLNLQTSNKTMSILQRRESAPGSSTPSSQQSGSNTPSHQTTSGSTTPTLHLSGSLTPSRGSNSFSSLTLHQPSGSNTPTLQRSGSTTPTSQQKKHDFTCRWERCGHDGAQTSADLAEHVSSAHAQKQVDKGAKRFVCLWDGCKVYNTPSSSGTWLMKHILDHCGDKPFRCVFSGCRLSFRTQGGLIRHVQSHLSEQPQQKTPRSKDESPGKVLKKKRIKGKRRISIVKTDDFFDSRIMDAVHHHLISMDVTTKVDSQGKGNSIICRSKVVGRRVEKNGAVNVLLHWTPDDVLPDSWVAEGRLSELSTCTVPLSKLSMEKMGQLQPGLTQATRRRRPRRK